jgi:hypothetical protein
MTGFSRRDAKKSSPAKAQRRKEEFKDSWIYFAPLREKDSLCASA